MKCRTLTFEKKTGTFCISQRMAGCFQHSLQDILVQGSLPTLSTKSMKEKKHIPTSDEPFAWKSPFAPLKDVTLPSTPTQSNALDLADKTPAEPKRHRGRVDIIRSTAHRGGKTVTVVIGLVGISQPEKERLTKEMQKACGAGGTVKEGRIEIQGDHRDTVARILTNAGFRPVFAGG